MIHRLIITDFMTHEHTVLELHSGVTVLTGPNNTGKSAVVEALRCVAENPPSASLIRHGAAKAVVRLELDDGSWVQWERTAGSVVYKVRSANGTETVYAKVGRGTVPEDIRALLRLQSLSTEAGSVDVHIGHQKDPIFLLDQPGSQAAAFFAASTEADYLLAMQQALKERTAEAQSDRRRLQQEIQQTEKDLAAFALLPAVAQQMKEAENLYAQIEATDRAVPALEALILTADNLAQRLRLWTQKSRRLQPLEAPPDVQDTVSLQNRLDQLVNAHSSIQKTRILLASLARLDTPPPIKNTAALHDLLHHMQRTHRNLSRRTQTSEVLSRVKEPPSLSDTAALARLAARLDETLWCLRVENQRKEAASPLHAPPALRSVQELAQTVEALTARHHHLRAATAQHQALEPLQAPPELRSLQDLQQKLEALQVFHRAVSSVEARGQRLKGLKPPPPLHDPNPLQQIIEAMERLEDQWHRMRHRLQDVQRQMEEKRQAVQKLLETMPLCPFCRQPMDPDHFLERAHAE